ncbi:hypothetical protein NECAME_06690 [Necator americanus]|uniref:Uncharacterized protein n=1 Tax=Necator americanus TaxID=51031 RepID=W2TUR6_NECAM|nr:hypothetical protein NECAME_06690 [Necator americanus]ETN84806.1 hypothetical protein NECAME_06690 [Necator americanus]
MGDEEFLYGVVQTPDSSQNQIIDTLACACHVCQFRLVPNSVAALSQCCVLTITYFGECVLASDSKKQLSTSLESLMHGDSAQLFNTQYRKASYEHTYEVDP